MDGRKKDDEKEGGRREKPTVGTAIQKKLFGKEFKTDVLIILGGTVEKTGLEATWGVKAVRGLTILILN